MPHSIRQIRSSRSAGWGKCAGGVLLLAAFLVTAAVGRTKEARVPHVLVLNCYHSGWTWWIRGVVSGIEETFQERGTDAELVVEYLDGKRLSDPEYILDTCRYLKRKYRYLKRMHPGRPFDIVIGTDDDALGFAREHSRDLFPDAPIVFCGISSLAPDALQGENRVTGVMMTLDVKDTLDLALRLHPLRRRVFVVNDGMSSTALAWRKTIEQTLAAYKDIEVVYLEGSQFTLSELADCLRSLPDDAVVLVGHWTRDKSGRLIPSNESARVVCGSSSAPVYCLARGWLGHGAVGGRVLEGRRHGGIAAGVALRVLNGEKPADIPINMSSTNLFVFDYTALERFGIRESDLPDGSILLNKPPSFYELHPFFVFNTLAVIVLLTAAVVFLGNNILSRKRAEKALRESVERFRELYDLAPVGYHELDKEGRVTRVNRTELAMLGYREDEMLGRPIWEFVEEQEVSRSALLKKLSGESVPAAAFERMYRRKDGSAVTFLIEDRILRDASGQITGVRSTLQDITERKRAEEALRESQNLFQVFMDQIPAHVYIKDEHFRLQYINRHMQDLLGEGNWLGKTAEEYRTKKILEDIREEDQEAISQGDIATSSSVVERDGVRHYYQNHKFAIQRDGKPPLLGGISFDVTEQVASEEERRRIEAQMQQAQKLESLGVLAGGIAHDFNNLLTGILGNVDLALMDLPPGLPVQENLREIETAAKRAAELSQQMLAYSGKGRFQISAVDLNKLVAEMSHLLEVSMSKKAMLKRNLADNLPAIEADAVQVRQVIMNLIINASEALDEEDGVITITTGAQQCGRAYLKQTYLEGARPGKELPEGLYVYLEVSDTGCGMDKETQEKIFDPFFTTKFTGRGLGLAAVLGIVRGHKGAVRLQSEPGRGTTLRVLFPALDRPADSIIKNETKETESWTGSGTVLLVDDEEMVRTVVKTMLERMGFEVLQGSDGLDALRIFRESADKIVCVLLDLTMPLMGGGETFRELRQIRKDARVILCSGYCEHDVAPRFAGKGLAGFLQKPYQSETLAARLREALEGTPRATDNVKRTTDNGKRTTDNLKRTTDNVK